MSAAKPFTVCTRGGLLLVPLQGYVRRPGLVRHEQQLCRGEPAAQPRCAIWAHHRPHPPNAAATGSLVRHAGNGTDARSRTRGSDDAGGPLTDGDLLK